MLKLITTILKLLIFFGGKYFAWTIAEKIKFNKRMENMATLLEEAMSDKSEAVNEDDYLANVEWEKKKRYESYKTEALIVLERGDGLEGLKLVVSLGMGILIAKKETQIVEALKKDLTVEDKAKLVAKILSNL
ncbi:hypothetical protein N9948_00465 [bacterium]|nr:hypothetical protein [bacterium]